MTRLLSVDGSATLGVQEQGQGREAELSQAEPSRAELSLTKPSQTGELNRSCCWPTSANKQQQWQLSGAANNSSESGREREQCMHTKRDSDDALRKH